MNYSNRDKSGATWWRGVLTLLHEAGSEDVTGHLGKGLPQQLKGGGAVQLIGLGEDGRSGLCPEGSGGPFRRRRGEVGVSYLTSRRTEVDLTGGINVNSLGETVTGGPNFRLFGRDLLDGVIHGFQGILTAGNRGEVHGIHVQR